jgi:hypothetical protein
MKSDGRQSEERWSDVRKATGGLEQGGSAEDGSCEQEEECEHNARVECGVLLFRTYIITLHVNPTAGRAVIPTSAAPLSSRV